MSLLARGFRQIGHKIQKHPAAAVTLSVILIAMAANGATALTSVSGQGAFVGETDTLDKYKSSFDRGTIVVLVDGDPSDPATLAAIDRFDRRVSHIENVETVVSPADQVRRSRGRIPDSQSRIRAVIPEQQTAVIRVVLEPGLKQSEQSTVYQKTIEGRAWADFPAGTPVTVTGNPAFNSQVSAIVQSSSQQLLSLAVVLMTVALYLLFRGVRLRLLPIVAVFIGVMYTFGAMGYLGIPNSTLSSAVFPILIGLGIDYSVQLHQRYEEELQTAPPREALPAALAGIGPPVLVAMVAAVLAFAATWINTLKMPAFVWFAQTSIIGIFLTFLTSLLVLVPVLTLVVRWRDSGDTTPENNPERSRSDANTTQITQTDEEIGTVGRSLGQLARLTASNPGIVIAIAGILLASGFYASQSLDVVADPEQFVPDDLPALLDLQQLRSQTGGGADVRYSVLVSGGNVKDPATLRWMEKFENVSSTQPQVTTVYSPADAIRQYNNGHLPRTRTGVTRVIERMPEHVRKQYFSEGYGHIVVIGERDMGPTQVIGMADNTDQALEASQMPPGVEAKMTGNSVLAPRLSYNQIVNRNVITAYGIVFIFALLVLYYRDPVKSIVPLVPMVFIVGWQGLYMAALDIAVSPLGASLGALTVGIGAEYTIIVMERYFEERTRGADQLDAIEIASQRVGKAITVSGMTTVFGFSALVLSPFPIVSDFGFLTVGVIFMTVVGALLVLPPTLVVLDQLQRDWHQWWTDESKSRS